MTFRKAYAAQRDAFNLPLLPARLYRGTDVATNPANRKPLATGPFRLASWEGGTIRLVRNTQYFGEPPAFEQVVLRVVPESSSAFQGLVTGALDESRLNALQRTEAAKDASLREVRYDEIAYTYLAWNNRLPQFTDARVRRALTMLISREAIAKSLYGGLARPANGPLPPGLWPHDPTLAPLPHDPGESRDAPRRGGVEEGEGRGAGASRRSLLLHALLRQREQPPAPDHRAGAARLPGGRRRDGARAAGVGCFSQKSRQGDYEACSLSLNLDPNPDLRPNWHSSQVPPNGMNHSFYRNPRADALMDELAVTFDREKARTLYAEVQRIITKTSPSRSSTPSRWRGG